MRVGYIEDYWGKSIKEIEREKGIWEKKGIDEEKRVLKKGKIKVKEIGEGRIDLGYIGKGEIWLKERGKEKIVEIN